MCDPPIRFVHQLDVGGEGRYPSAWNLNPRLIKTLGPGAGQPIPNLIVGRAEAIPMPDASVEQIIVERTPLSDQSLREISRVAARTARVILRHARPPWSDPHKRAVDFWGPPIQQRLCRLGGQIVQESQFILEEPKSCQRLNVAAGSRSSAERNANCWRNSFANTEHAERSRMRQSRFVSQRCSRSRISSKSH